MKTNLQDKDFSEILKGSIFTFIAKIISVILGFFFTLIITRYYGADAMGVYALIGTFFAFALIPSLLGTSTSVLRFIPEHIIKYSHKSALYLFKKVFSLVFIVSLIVSLITFVSAEVIAEYVFQKKNLTSLFAIASIFIVIQALSTLNISAIRALKKIRIYIFFQVLYPILNILILLTLTSLFFDPDNPVYTLFYSSFIIFIISVFFVVKIFYHQKKHEKKIVVKLSYKKILTTSFPMFLTSVMAVILTQTDIVMIGMYQSTTEVGIYSVAMKLALLTSFVLTSINTIIAPKFAELYHSGDVVSLEKVVKKSSKMIFYTTLPIILGLIIFGKIFLNTFGEEFLIGYTVLVVLSIGQFINSIVGSVGYLMNMSGYQKEYSYISFGSAMVNIVLNSLLIPIYGINGAATASLISIAILNIVSLIIIKIKFGYFPGYIPFRS